MSENKAITVKKINDIDGFASLRGKQSMTSEWLCITQSMINRFADATFDKQWIHVDPVKATLNGPFGGTIVHGYMLLSLIPFFLDQIFEINNLDHIVNYGIKNLTFKNSVKPGDQVRLHVTVEKAKDLGDICQVEFCCRLEIDGQDIPAFEGVITFLYYFRINE